MKSDLLTRKNIRPLSEHTYAAHISLFDRWRNGRKPSQGLVSEYLSALSEQGKAPNTVATAANAIAWAYGKDIVIQRPKIQIGEPKYISKSDVERLIASCPSLPGKTAIIILFDGALRISELLSLHLDGIDWSHGVITVTRKGGHIARVKLTDKGMAALKAWLEKRRSNSPLVFSSDYFQMYRLLKRTARKAGIEHFTPHVLRHSRVVHLLEAGTPLERVADITGHRSILTTQAIYGRLRAEDLGKYLVRW